MNETKLTSCEKKVYAINVFCTKWFDKINGNTYFSCKVNVLGKNNIEFILPFQYGNGENYLDATFRYLINNKILPNNIIPKSNNSNMLPDLRYFCKQNNINLIYHETKVNQRDMIK
jgi:hypothetical protein